MERASVNNNISSSEPHLDNYICALESSAPFTVKSICVNRLKMHLHCKFGRSYIYAVYRSQCSSNYCCWCERAMLHNEDMERQQ